MAKHKKVYGYTIALWEVGKSCPSLFRSTADWKESVGVPTTSLWRAMIEPSYMPFPFRRLLSWIPHRDAYGDAWSLCHFWSNFEIADMDFFRSRAYQQYFEYLDKTGGFYYERVCTYFLMLTFPKSRNHADQSLVVISGVMRRYTPSPSPCWRIPNRYTISQTLDINMRTCTNAHPMLRMVSSLARLC